MTDNNQLTNSEQNNHGESAPVSNGKSGGVFFAIIATVISLSVAGLCAYLYYTGVTERDSLVQQLNTLSKKVELDKTQINNELQVIDKHIDGLESQVHGMSMVSNHNLILVQLNQLIGMANQSLVVYNDVRSALKLLNYVAGLLQTSLNGEYAEIKAAVAADINRLGSVQDIDTNLLVAKLNTLGGQINSLPLIDYDKTTSANLQESYVRESAVTSAAADSSLWYKFWANLKHALRSIVVVSNTNYAKQVQLLPNKEIIIQQNIKLYLLNAKIALLQHDQVSWKFNLQNVKADLTTYFSQTSITRALVINLDELINVNITLNAINIDATLKALNKLNKLQ